MTIYANINFKTKKAFKEAVNNGEVITLYSPGLGVPIYNGIEYISGPHYPEPHKWFAEVTVKNGVVVKVK